MILQRSPEWYSRRLGKATASRVADIVARTKTGWGASRQNYAADLIAERLTGVPADNYQSPAMRWGMDQEDAAKALYTERTGLLVEPIDFVDHAEIGWAGASPDGLVETQGLIEVKAPLTATHLDRLLGGSIDGRHMTQMMWQMACTGRQWCDYISFDPRLPPRMQLHIERVHRDVSRILELEEAVTAFLDEIAGKVAALTDLYGQEEAA